MLSLFRTNQASAGLLLFLYALVLQLPVLIGWAELPPISASGGIGGRWVLSWSEGRFFLAALLPVFLITGQGIVANVLVTRHRLSRKITQFPGLFLVLCWALVPAFRAFHPVQVAGFFMMLSLLSLGRVYKRDEPAVALFNAGAWLGGAVLFCPSFLVLLLAYFISIGILRKPDLRSMFQFLTGLALPIFLCLAYAYIFADFTEALQVQFGHLGWWQWPALAVPDQLGLGILGLLILFVTATFGGTTQLLNIEGKKNVSILYWLFFFLLLSTGLSANSGVPYLQTLTVPIGIILGLRFILIPTARAEFFHLLLFTAAIGSAIWSVYT